MFGQLVIQIDRCHLFGLILTAQRLGCQLALQGCELCQQLFSQKGHLSGAIVVGRRLQLGEVLLHFGQIIAQSCTAVRKQRSIEACLRDRRVAAGRDLAGQYLDLLF
ncbi:hypothetical protein D3C76_1603300 [compost metagenome]